MDERALHTCHSNHDRAVASIAESADEKYIVTGSYDKTVCIRKTPVGPSLTLEGHTDWVREVRIINKQPSN